MIARDRLGLDAREFTGVDSFFDRDHGGAGFPRAETNKIDAPVASGSSCSQKIRARIRRVSRGASADMGDDVAAFDEQLTVERNADRLPRALASPGTGVTGQPSTVLIFAILPAGMIMISSPAARRPDSMRPATMRRSSNL